MYKILLSVLFLAICALHTSAQQAITLYVALPTYQYNFVDESIFDDFESERTNINVVLVDPLADSPVLAPNPMMNPSEHLDFVLQQAERADVILVDNLPSHLATQAGYFLNLSPLLATDNTVIDDFFENALEAASWGNNVWALPLTIDLSVLFFDPVAFENAGLPFPDENWAFEDLLQSVDTLYTAHPDRASLQILNTPAFVSMFLDAEISTLDLFEISSLDPLMQSASKLETLSQILNEESGVELASSAGNAPLMIGDLSLLSTAELEGYQAAPLPQINSTFQSRNLVISAGTNHPELSYELALFLTNHSEFLRQTFDFPARRSHYENYPGTLNTNDTSAVIASRLLENAIPLHESMLSVVVANQAHLITGEADMLTFLEDIYAKRDAALSLAAERQNNNVTIKTTFTEEVATSTVLNFGIDHGVNAVPNLELWEDITRQFIDNERGIDDVVFGDPNLLGVAGEHTADCYYLSGVSSSNITGQLQTLAIDTLLASDGTLDEDVFLASALDQARDAEGQLRGLPLTIEPNVIRINATILENHGIPLPTPDWTLQEFVTLLQWFREQEINVRISTTQGNQILVYLLLMDLYGEAPFPPDNLSDDEVYTSVTQALDLAKNSLLPYEGVSRSEQFSMHTFGDDRPIGMEFSEMRSLHDLNSGNTSEDVFYALPYPVHEGHVAATFTVGLGLISPHTTYPELCYRYIVHLSNHPELFYAMPARHDKLTDDVLTVIFSDETASFYQMFQQHLQSPDITVMPSIFLDLNHLEQSSSIIFLKHAFDRYTIEDVPVETALSDAAVEIEIFSACLTDQLDLSDATVRNDMFHMLNTLYACVDMANPVAIG